MKASELIKELEKLIETEGDLEVVRAIEGEEEREIYDVELAYIQKYSPLRDEKAIILF